MRNCNIPYEKVKQCHNNSHVLINALPERSYLNRHIPGSISLPVDDYKGVLNDSQINNIETSIQENATEDILSQLNKDKDNKVYDIPIIVYCANTSCNKSTNLIDILLKLGFLDVSNYSGGMKEWVLKGGPIEKGRCNKNIIGGSPILKEIKEKVTNWTYDPDKNTTGAKKTKKKTVKKNVEEENIEEDDEDVEEDESIKRKKTVNDEFDLYGKEEKLVYEDIIYIHNVENNEVFNKNNEKVGTFKGKNIKWKSNEDKQKHISSKDKFNEEISSSSEDEDDSSDDSSSSDEELLEDIKNIKKDVDNIKYRKHKLSLKCMSNVTPKVYNNKFRGWGLTYWGD